MAMGTCVVTLVRPCPNKPLIKAAIVTLRIFLSQDDGLKPSAKDLKRALIDATEELKTMPLELPEGSALEGDVPKELLALESSSSSSAASSDTDDDAANTDGDGDDDGEDDGYDADDGDDGSDGHVKKKPAKGCESDAADADDDDDADSPVSSLHSSEAELLIPGPSKKNNKKTRGSKDCHQKG